MSTLTSASTHAEIEAAYIDNASYEEDSSVAKAKAFVTACRLILFIRPSRSARGQMGEMEWDLESIRLQMEQAQAWISANDTTSAGASAVHPDFSYYRGM